MEFERVPHQSGDEFATGKVYIVPSQVVKVAPVESAGQGLFTRITLVEGEAELVDEPPSVVNTRLRNGR